MDLLMVIRHLDPQYLDGSVREAKSTCVTPHVSKPHDYVNHMFMRP
jgi:hypothetical protein